MSALFIANALGIISGVYAKQMEHLYDTHVTPRAVSRAHFHNADFFFTFSSDVEDCGHPNGPYLCRDV